MDGQPTFEQAYNRLGEAVRSLEGGGLTLENATALYEEGMRLVQLCNQLLGSAEQRMTQLRDAYSPYTTAPATEDAFDVDK